MTDIQKSLICRRNVLKRFRILFLFFMVVAYLLIPAVSSSKEVRSKAAVVMDASTGKILYARNPNLKLPPASTTKLITAIVVIENKDFSDVVRISKRASKVAPSKAGFKAGDKVTIETLLYAALMKSANDAAVALAEAVSGSEAKFVRLMNKKAIEIGMKNTKFKNPHGLPASGQYTTAYDLSKIMSYALNYPKLKEIIGTRVAKVLTENGDSIFLKNTNKLLWYDNDLVGGKTGYTRRAKHCLVCAAERDSNTIVVTVLGSPSRNNLWKESETLIDKGFKVMSNKNEKVIHFTSTTNDALKVKKISYDSVKSETVRKITEKGKMKAKVFVKKKPGTKKFVTDRNRGKKVYRVAEKIENRNKG